MPTISEAADGLSFLLYDFIFILRKEGNEWNEEKKKGADYYVFNLVIRDHILQREFISLPTVLSLLALNGRRRSVKPLNCL